MLIEVARESLEVILKCLWAELRRYSVDGLSADADADDGGSSGGSEGDFISFPGPHHTPRLRSSLISCRSSCRSRISSVKGRVRPGEYLAREKAIKNRSSLTLVPLDCGPFASELSYSTILVKWWRRVEYPHQAEEISSD
jgi:hypothetical protein